ncbi:MULTISPECIES: hypothetical protein [Streptomyces]|uniref:hypothetical protein n=1 Tax=Streptomyces TaxID=1883 RepID=UPI0004BE03AD|nr:MULTISPECIES: hypothetical protein [Streptomyces]KJY20913.1 hypothetical protein VR43_13480 [Streptomyces sp. NRRL S-104]KOU33657.1 hypothetical protein ADK53_18095 [Streptomyces sp. WM6373]KOU61451.1 hypothetical protein ADK96_29320 [Streptomyces sp. IGB124]KOU74278.1 hypothetical protein ADK61_20310 [Streptomyces sp. XY66]KOU87738.1 hypothetical protein ADK93_15320 [Streptomyces sp. XY58]
MRTTPRTTTRIAGVLTGLALALGGAALTAPAAHADVTACIDQVEREIQGGEAPDSVRMACYVGLTGDSEQCVVGLTAGGVTNGTATVACRVAPN